MTALPSRLSALRRRLRLVSLTWGLSLLVVALLGGVIVAGFLDWEVGLPSLVRATLLVALLAVAGSLAFHSLVMPLAGKADDLTLALRVEEAYPILNDALASTVQFLQQPDTEAAGSASMRREAVQRALRLAQGCDFNKVVKRRGLRWVAAAALAVTTLAIFLCVWRPALATVALLRLANPYGDHDWPRATQLAVHCRDRVAIGQPYVIKGELSGVLPGKAVIEFEGLSSSREVKEYPITADAEHKNGTFLAKLDMTRQQHPFRFRVRANDDTFPKREGAWFAVRVAQPPRLASLGGLPTPQVVLHYPAYTELASPERLSPGVGRIEAIAGTSVVLRGAADRPITLASVSYRPGDPAAMPAAMFAPFGLQTPLEALAALAGGRAVWDTVLARLDADRQSFTIDFMPWVSGSYVLRLEDADGLAKDYEYELRVVADPAPVVSLERPAASQSVLPDAAITLQVQAEDDIFALRSAYLEYRRKDKDGQPLDTEPKRVRLYDHEAVGATLPQLLTALARQPVPVPVEALRLRPKRLQLGQRWSLAGLGREGDIIVIQACADDFNDVAANPNVGRSVEVELRIVGRAALAAVLDEAEAKVQQELLRLREWQEKALKKVVQAEQQLKATGRLRPDDVDGLVEAEQLQKQIQARVGAAPEEGLRAELRRLEQMMRDNKLPPSGTRDRLKLMKDELERLAREHLPQIEPQLTTARQKLANGGAKGTADKTKGKDPPKGKGEADKTRAELGKARAHQEEVQQSLDELLKHLDRWASTQEIKGETRAALQEQRDLKGELEKVNRDHNPADEQAQAAVRKVAEFQRRLADKVQRLIDKMERVGQERAAKDPATAEILDKAAQVGKDAMLPGELKDTGDQLQVKDAKTGEPRPQIKRAIDQQGESIKTLENMTQALEESRKDEVERLIKKQKEQEKNLDELVEKLEKLQKKVEEAKQNPDPEQRKAELQKLARQQRELEDEVRKKSRELARLQAQRAGKDLAKAADQMGRAAQQLDDGEDPEEAQKDALERLEQAQEDLKLARDAAEEELAREQLARIADQIKGLKERQDAAGEESERIHKQVLRHGWTPGMVQSLKGHADAQAGLGKEAAGLAEKLKGAPVFELLMKKAGKAMQAASASIGERGKKAVDRQGMFPLDKELLDDENQAEARTVKLQKEAGRRLDRLLEALKPELDLAKNEPKDDEPGGEPGGGQQGQKSIRGGDGIPPVAQIKALRDEQKELYERTKAFAKEHPDAKGLTPEQRAELEGLHVEQQELFRLFRELTAPANEGEKQ
jgi:hypothetical protein